MPMDHPYLLTPGPLTTAASVKQAMLKDWGSWDGEFRAMTRQLRDGILQVLEPGLDTGSQDYECIPMQGSGTFVVEAMLGTILPEDSHCLVLINGAYGQRMAQTLDRIGRAHTDLNKGDYLPPRGSEVATLLDQHPHITHVLAVHCETSSGILNPLQEIADAVHAAGRRLLIDSMSAFGALPTDPNSLRFDALVSSANKCIEGVPGFGFALIKKDVLQGCEGRCHSLSLDLYDQWKVMESSGQWRYTPPTHVVAACLEALRLHQAEGGSPARLQRYSRNRDALVTGMRQLGFETLLDGDWLSPIIVTFLQPKHANYRFDRFYELLKNRGFIIYPGKLTVVDSFRVGCIGQMTEDTLRDVVTAVSETLGIMDVDSGEPSQAALDERSTAMRDGQATELM